MPVPNATARAYSGIAQHLPASGAQLVDFATSCSPRPLTSSQGRKPAASASTFTKGLLAVSPSRPVPDGLEDAEEGSLVHQNLRYGRRRRSHLRSRRAWNHRSYPKVTELITAAEATACDVQLPANRSKRLWLATLPRVLNRENQLSLDGKRLRQVTRNGRKYAVRVRQKWYLRAVLDAQTAARDALKAGVSCGAIDAAARNVLQHKGLGRYFVHSTGHGIGLEIHEDPRIARDQKRFWRRGNVVRPWNPVYMWRVWAGSASKTMPW